MPSSSGRNNRKAVLVVGTTPDYIDWIREAAPGAAIFLTDPKLRDQASETCPAPSEEMLCDLSDFAQAAAFLEGHLRRWGIEPEGVAVYDCESMELAAFLAERYGLPCASVESIRRCRDKYVSKKLWKENALSCPEVRVIHSADKLVDFHRKLAHPVVLKPLCGSGSELVFRCTSPLECQSRYDLVLQGLYERGSDRLYSRNGPATELLLAEELIRGPEYSCDFIVDGDAVAPIRLTRKICGEDRPFGTTEGYLLCSGPPEGILFDKFAGVLSLSARSLGISRGICMLDFIVQDHQMVLLELAPRPGGDCLPQLLRVARQLDIILLNLDFARSRPVIPAWPGQTDPYLGIRIIAGRSGILRRIDTEELKRDPRVKEVGLFCVPGHPIILPPYDYRSWVLGYIIARLDDRLDAQGHMAELLGKLSVEIE